MIPRIIHYVWLGGGAKPPLFSRCLESWKAHCPDYEIREWNESNFDFSDNAFAVQAYRAKKYGYVADYIRLRVLYEYGGIYLDTDVEMVKPFDDLLANDFFLSFENDVYVETATLGAAPRHPFLQKLLAHYERKQFFVGKRADLTPNTVLFTLALEKYYAFRIATNGREQRLAGEMGVTVYPADYFSPINYTTKKLRRTPRTYSIHYFDASWFSKKLKFREKVLRGVYYLFGRKLFALFTKAYVCHERKKYAALL